ncbi:OLC1v1027315C3 [Oldenlandia corymbosa var. corymbosa]|uniref:OLC1v1027315C3 n=1 Tax=Oldenlandia corymbosa var. corymbosa TaxID=529605 RepID=A0AAV1C960_OLDCO|nr:OLC1v1027315C3 [Oldenlandia corymbosa var. corymbosa]
MDDFNSLIPWYQDDDPFLFQDTNIPNLPYPDQTTFPDLKNHHVLSSDCSVPMISTTTTSPTFGESDLQVVTTTATTSSAPSSSANKKGKRLRKPANTDPDNDNETPVDLDHKRALHRDIERQRRQEMANLYASLRMLLPLEYIKGKRATTDHIHQAVNYIKHMEGKIKELEVKRNKLRQLPGENGQINVADEARSRALSNVAFTVRSCSGGGVEILMNCDPGDDCFPLSKVLKVILNEGLNVVNCTYTKVDRNFHCTIQTDVEVIISYY